jgi:hypothetical protein
MWNREKSLIGVGLGAALVPVVLTISVQPTRAQAPSHAVVNAPAISKRAAGPTVGQSRDPRAGPSPEELELLGLRVETERAQLRLAESRLEQAKRWEARVWELTDHGRLPVVQFMEAQDNALVRQSDVVAQKAALRTAELRLSQAQQGISSDRSASSASEGQLAEVERRLAALEGAVRRLRPETKHVQLDLPIEISSSRK